MRLNCRDVRRTRSVRACVVVALLLAPVALAPAAVAAPPATQQAALGRKIVAYCKGQLDKPVGDGECAALAEHALRECGAKGQGDDHPNKGDYAWGELVLVVNGGAPVSFESGKPADVRAGDVIQFRDAQFEGRKGRGTYTQSAPHHTAVVAEKDATGITLKIFDQNSNGQRVVKEGQIRLNDLKSGWLRFYRPIPTNEPKSRE